MKYSRFNEWEMGRTYAIAGDIFQRENSLYIVKIDVFGSVPIPNPGDDANIWQKLEFTCEDCVEMTGMKPSSLTQDEFWVCPCLEEYHRHFPLDLNGRPEGCCTRFAFKSESMPQLHAEMLRVKKQEEIEIQKMLKMQLLSMKTYEANRE